ncbi:MAG: hypothetical protein KME05_01605 [Gloeocapsa sp. UFS-A4-WI-NPMV-4B04]|jgi:hypothetical protein|nr:hypothetical protein [Gloeocapsa sp. UFS-A4-WI-NPMV-4B04]
MANPNENERTLKDMEKINPDENGGANRIPLQTPNSNNLQVTDSEPDRNINNRDKAISSNSGKFLLNHGILTFGLLAITLSGAFFLNWFAGEQSDKWTQGLKYNPMSQQIPEQLSSKDKNLQAYINKLPNATLAEKARLFEQLKEIQNRARSHISVARAFYIWNYQSLSIAAVSSIVAAVSLLFLSRRGWDGSNKYVINVFIVSFSITVVVGVFPALFKQEENISNNTRTYLAYIALDNRLNSYIATQEFTGLKPANTSNSTQLLPVKNIKDVIRSVDDELATLNNIYIGFDASKIPNYREVFNEVNQQN